MAIFGKKALEEPPPAGPQDPGQMALDTLAANLRSMSEFALEPEGSDVETFRAAAEAWAQHVTLAAPPPGREWVPGPDTGRRDWAGVRQFVREYCRGSSKQATTVAADLREVVWVFIRNFGEALARDEEADQRLRGQMARLEGLVAAQATGELKREVQEVVAALTRDFEERRRRQRSQMASLGEAVRSLGDELESARREGETDPLTRVANRKAFDAHLAKTVEMSRAFGQPAALVLVDVDRFKEVNDQAGHPAGDAVLRAVADALVRVFLRRSDLVARFGGDEFAAVLRETALRDALLLAERAAARVREAQVEHDGRKLRVTLSVGVAALEPGEDAAAWFARTDRGLYAAKSGGRDRVATGPPTDAPEAPGPR